MTTPSRARNPLIPGVVGNPSRGNLSRPRHISLGYLSRLVRFARKSVTTLGN